MKMFNRHLETPSILLASENLDYKLFQNVVRSVSDRTYKNHRKDLKFLRNFARKARSGRNSKLPTQIHSQCIIIIGHFVVLGIVV